MEALHQTHSVASDPLGKLHPVHGTAAMKGLLLQDAVSGFEFRHPCHVIPPGRGPRKSAGVINRALEVGMIGIR